MKQKRIVHRLMSQGTDEGGNGPSNPWPQRWYQWAQHQDHELSSLNSAMVRAAGLDKVTNSILQAVTELLKV